MGKVTKILVWVVLVAAAVVVLFTWVFPWVERMQQDPTMGAPAAAVQVARSPR